MIYRLGVLLALLALIVFVVVFSGPQRESVTPASVSGPQHDPGYSARQARLVQTGADGLPLYTLDAATIEQQPDQNTVELAQVQLGFRDANGNQWTAQANRGELAQNSGVVKLEGSVHVTGTLAGSDDPAQISTEHLSFDTDAQVATTQDPVTVVMTGRELNAQGLIASLKERRVQLQSAVHGSFLP
ncbi:MAG TPA: LPS export ABC transporter periplasmic protein LptC [Steroidobacteraceae bacterium]|nr:LPS export ABC transporter periplasmic protein LptC [Steroidobacteraceae bacterium]